MTQQTKNKNHLKLLCLGVSLPASFYHLLLTQKAELSMPEAPHIVHCYKYLCLASYQWSIVETKENYLHKTKGGNSAVCKSREDSVKWRNTNTDMSLK